MPEPASQIQKKIPHQRDFFYKKKLLFSSCTIKIKH
jgi:hypothetical protein